MSVILVGDITQLAPVGQKELQLDKPTSATGIRGYTAYRSFNKLVTLAEKLRQKWKGLHQHQMLKDIGKYSAWSTKQ